MAVVQGKEQRRSWTLRHACRLFEVDGSAAVPAVNCRHGNPFFMLLAGDRSLSNVCLAMWLTINNSSNSSG